MAKQDLKEKDEGLAAPRKRLIALHKAQGNLAEAVKELHEYLDDFMTDYEAWIELANMYLACEQYKHAAFCYEELIVHQPYHYAHHLKYAEIQYTIGGHECIELARKHYQQAVELKPECPRAVYGIALCATALGSGKKGKDDNESMRKLMHWSRSKLDTLYSVKKSKEDVVKSKDAALDGCQSVLDQ